MSDKLSIAKLSLQIGLQHSQLESDFNTVTQKVRKFVGETDRITSGGKASGGKGGGIGLMLGVNPQQISGLAGSFQKMIVPAAKFGLIMGGIALAARQIKINIDGTKDQFGKMAEDAKLADKLGSSIERFSQLQFAGGKKGVDSEQLDSMLTNLSRRLSEAEHGSEDAAKAFSELHLSASDLLDLDPADAFGELADAFKNLPSNADRARLSVELFGRSGPELMRLLSGGKDGLAAMADQADKLGHSVSRVDALRISAFNKEWADLDDEVAGARRRAAMAWTDPDSPIMQFKRVVSGVDKFISRGIEFVGNMGLDPFGNDARKHAELEQQLKRNADIQRQNENILRRQSVEMEKQEKLTQERAEAAKKLQEELKQRGSQLAQSLRLPAEILEDSVRELDQLFRHAAIDADILQRGMQQAAEDFERATELTDKLTGRSRSVSAATQFSNEGFSAVQNAINTGRELKTAEQRRKQQHDKTNKILEQIKEKIAADGQVNFAVDNF